MAEGRGWGFYRSRRIYNGVMKSLGEVLSRDWGSFHERFAEGAVDHYPFIFATINSGANDGALEGLCIE